MLKRLLAVAGAACLVAPATATASIHYSLTVTKAGTGTGTVTSSPAGINCGATCTASFRRNTVVTLTATPGQGSTFAGYSGACTGSTCTVTMNAGKTVTATFNQSVSCNFSTSVTAGATYTLGSWTWTFDPGCNTSVAKGQFWADGTQLHEIVGSPPYSWSVPCSALGAGSHTLGHSWDLASGAHMSPGGSGYAVTIVDCGQPQDCENVFADDWETVYPTPSGLNKDACPMVTGTLPGDNINSQGTWSNNSGNSQVSPYINNAVPPVPGNGTRAVKVAPPAGTNATWADHWRHTHIGSDVYYAMMFYFPAGWVDPAPGTWEATAEFNYHPFIWSAPIGFSTHTALKIWIQTGYCVFQQGCTYDNGGDFENGIPCSSGFPGCVPISADGSFLIPRGSMNTGVWHEVIMHVHWTPDTTGVVEGWWKRKGDPAWTKTVDLSGFPTLQHGTDTDGHVWTGPDEDGVTAYDHFGIYRDNAGSPADTYYLDDYCTTTTLTAAQSCLP